MRPPSSPLGRAVPLALALVLFTSAAALAHPYVHGGEAPVDSLASLTLDLAHGCTTDDGHDHGEGGEPTTDVSLEVPPEMRIVEVPEVDGWEVALERAADGRVEVVTWTATTAQEPAPAFPLDVVLDGEPGTELYLRVFQACDDLSYRWVGTPDAPAEDPAVRLTVTAADPDRPAPPPAEAPADDGPDDAAPENDQPRTDEDAVDTDDPAEQPPAEDATDESEEVEEPDAVEGAPIVTTEPETSPVLWLFVGLVVAALVIALILALRRRPPAAAAPEGELDDGDRP